MNHKEISREPKVTIVLITPNQLEELEENREILKGIPHPSKTRTEVNAWFGGGVNNG